MSISGSMIGLNDPMLGNSISGCLTKDNFGIGLDGCTVRIGASGLIDDEVNHRPAGQQWPVCTP